MNPGPPPSQGSQDGLRGDERGISDVVAHVLTFAIIIAGVTLVAAGAYDPLIDLSDREQIENSERGLMAAAASMDEIHQQSATERSFNLVLGGGSIYLNDSEITVGSPQASGLNDTYQVNTLEHRFEQPDREVTVAYEAGGVFRDPGLGASYRPSLRCGDNTAIVSLVELDAVNFYLSSGYYSDNVLDPRNLPSDAPVADLSQSLIFSAELNTSKRTVETFSGGTGNIIVDLAQSGNVEQWRDYFDRDESDWTAIGDTDTLYTCSGIERALVRVIAIDLESE